MIRFVRKEIYSKLDRLAGHDGEIVRRRRRLVHRRAGRRQRGQNDLV